jgi:hypothetical protein
MGLAVDEWKRTAGDHPGTAAATEWLTNWDRYRAFQQAGVAPDGFFVVRDDRLVLRSTRFCFAGGVLVNGDQRVPWAFGEPLRPRTRMKTRLVSPAAFGSVVGPLRRVCLASVLTGNPVVWC